MKIRKATIRDIDSLLYLWQQLMDYHKSLNPLAFEFKKNARQIMKKFFVKNIKSRNSIVLLAEENNRSIGYLMAFIEDYPPIYVEDKIAYISDGYVAEGFRNKGVMRRMIAQVKIFFKNKNMNHIYLRTHSKNKIGITSWKNLGFREEYKNMFMKL